MNAELFIHGPRNAFYGASSEVAYSKLFDNSSIKDEIRFVVEVRTSIEGNRYAYYTYCRYSNVQDYGGRNGAYIGLSVRLDSYYTNLRAMYTVLEAVFNKGVLGLLVDKTSTGFQYRVEAFEPVKQQILERIERPLGSYLSNLYNPSEFITIDGSFKKGQDLIKGIDDNKYAEARLNDIKLSGKIVFASTAVLDSILEIQKRSEQLLTETRNQHAKECEAIQQGKEQALEELRSQYEKSYADAQEQYEFISSKYETSQQKLSSLEKSCSQVQKEKKCLESERDQLKSKLDSISGYAEDIRQLKDEVKSLKKKIDDLENENARLKRSSVSMSPIPSGTKSKHAHEEDSFRNKVKAIRGSSNIKQLGEGLRRNCRAFFLVLAIALVCITALVLGHSLRSRKEAVDVNETIKTETEQVAEQKEITESFPNEVSRRLYPDIEKSDETIIVDGDLVSDSELSLSMAQYRGSETPFFQWEIIGPDGIPKSLDGVNCKFTPEQNGQYYIKVFVDQSLVGFRSIIIE